MGDRIGNPVEGILYFAEQPEFDRLLKLSLPPLERAALFSNLCRINTLYMIARAGSGHIGSSFSSLDIVSWLFLNNVHIPGKKAHHSATGVYYSSKGHDAPGLYSVLIALGYLDLNLLHQLRRIEGLPGHPDISTPGIITNTGSLGMGISKAKGMAFANRSKGQKGDIFVMTGDGELQEGQIWESLISAANNKLDEITVIVDHNKLQSDTFVKTVNSLGDLEAKFSSFGWHVERCNGNDLASFSNALSTSQSVSDKPNVIIADTIKGCGVSFMEHTSLNSDEDMYDFHSGAPNSQDYAEALKELIEKINNKLNKINIPTLSLESLQTKTTGLSKPMPTKPQKLIQAYGQALLSQGERHPNLISLDADLVLDTGQILFREKFPERFVECGIAEQDMVSQAGGMALSNLLPVVHSFACFLSTRPNEQIYNNATEDTKIIYVGSLAGLIPGGPGYSHQSVRDISALGSMPGLVLIEPATEYEVELALEYCINQTNNSTYLRLVSVPVEIPYTMPSDYSFKEGQGIAITEGDDAILFTYGPIMLTEAYLASEKLYQNHSLKLKVINLPWLNKVDYAWLTETISGCNRIYTLDNHYTKNGQGDMVLSALAQNNRGYHYCAKKFGVTVVPFCGTTEEVLSAHGLDAESLSQNIADDFAIDR